MFRLGKIYEMEFYQRLYSFIIRIDEANFDFTEKR
jgi:hypothetical protein